ncbi:MAG: hypothetical protein LH660_13100 [Phormidesmis sp. CAN_BIN36]|nr:hypothetical protein [Phormidesmis sp. CAN_BIN36]
MSWIILKTASTRWEAELMEQVLLAHDIPARILDLGSASYFGVGSPTALQVRPQDQWMALLLLSPIDEESLEEAE